MILSGHFTFVTVTVITFVHLRANSIVFSVTFLTVFVLSG